MLVLVFKSRIVFFLHIFLDVFVIFFLRVLEVQFHSFILFTFVFLAITSSYPYLFMVPFRL